THAPDGYAIDFVRVLINPHPFNYVVSVKGSVIDANTHMPLPSVSVSAGLSGVSTHQGGDYSLTGVPAGLVIGKATAPGYDEGVATVDLAAGQTGQVNFALQPHRETTADLEKVLAENGSVAVYGVHFDFASADLRPDSMSALSAIRGLIVARPNT